MIHLHQRVRSRLSALEDATLHRTLRAPSGIDLASNDYLGLATHPFVRTRMIEGINRDGCGSTGSRLLRGERESFASVERTFAGLKDTARALYFSSGYLANIALLTTFPEAGDLILSDDRNHASLIDGIRLSRAAHVVFPHGDAAAAERLIQGYRGDGQIFVVTESLFSMDGDMAPLVEYAALCRASGAALIVDEAHAVGIYGTRGSGLIEATGVADDVFVSVNTAGKALGVAGAFVAGAEWAIDYLIQRARPFIFSTAPPPALAWALDASLSLLSSEPERRARLGALVRLARDRMVAAGIRLEAGCSQIIPVILGENARAVAVAEGMQAAGFDVRAIRPPTVAPGTARLRITINTSLTEETIDRFVSALAAQMSRPA